MAVYVDGQFAAPEASDGGANIVGGAVARLGALVANGEERYQGQGDENQLFGRALTQSEIVALSNAYERGTCKP